MENKEMDGACGTYGEKERCICGFGWKDLRGRDHLEDQAVDGRVIL
jgi:hypothetical protein